MVRTYLARGLLAGLLASVCAFGFAKILAEPSVGRAVRYETQHAHARGETPEAAVVSRTVQNSVGLGSGVIAAGVALGGLFALAFAFVYRRAFDARARTTAALLALGAFVGLALVPFLKYPANPPAVGLAETLAHRTSLYFTLIAVALLALGLSVAVQRRLRSRLDEWNATLVAAGVFVVIVATAYIVMPGVNEVPAGFPILVLWRFRLASLGTQAVLWTTIGVSFGALTERAEANQAANRSTAHV